jgi:hypothetical protein
LQLRQDRPQSENAQQRDKGGFVGPIEFNNGDHRSIGSCRLPSSR